MPSACSRPNKAHSRLGLMLVAAVAAFVFLIGDAEAAERGPSSDSFVAVGFWVFLATVAVASIIASYLRRRETEQTIRAAMERGQALDVKTLELLLAPKRATPTSLMTGGIITVFLGLGLAVMGAFISADSDKQILPIYGVGAMITTVGIGILVAAWAVYRWAKSQPPTGP
jgi:hypothetical protein